MSRRAKERRVVLYMLAAWLLGLVARCASIEPAPAMAETPDPFACQTLTTDTTVVRPDSVWIDRFSLCVRQ